MQAAGLYYETRGNEGEPVLIIQGALAEAGATAQLADTLSEAGHQVISYDHRGLSRSSSSVDVSIESHATDAAELLKAVTDRPALVVGTSIGAVIGLQLAMQYPELVRGLVAHEPPLPTVEPDPEQLRGLDEVAALARDDVFAAGRHFATLGGPRDEDQEDGASPEPSVGDIQANLRRFFAHDFEAVRAYNPDIARLIQSTREVPIVLTGGSRSRGRWEYRCAQRLAETLGQELIELPGGHVSLVSHPWATASVLLSLPVFKES
ncbi:alpha/beta fold hydrolase [Saccharopolyspora pogona]|uniref:alpha/beta fold hydrolase n=1 Tax=Saccharopolyspora pogona TaxID=333966 RepID=UPI0016856189|nr:alpha/beta hydrolase [Saccharopolyspora pogona]